MTAERYEPSRDLPPYTYVPGRAPHPKSDPHGHAYGRAEEPLAEFDPARLDRSPDFRYGVDLFHAGFYWEAHEVWEALWHAVGRAGPTAELLKGLIKLAAAGVKVLEGIPSGAASHARRAAQLLEHAAAGGIATVGLTPTRELIEASQSIAAQPPLAADELRSPKSVLPVVIRL
jgi:predicted metal-dependent hydrolase